MKHEVYHGWWEHRGDVEESFDVDLPAAVRVLFASYDGDASTEAFVLFQQEGALYEVTGAWSGSAGLEGQWEPERTTLAALRHRLDHGLLLRAAFTEEADHALRAVLDRRS